MQVFKGIEEVKGLKVDTVAWGSFDGVHRGHWEILMRTRNTNSHLLVTFEPHPRMILSNDTVCCLSTLDEKTRYIRNFGIKNLLVIPFNLTFAQFGPEDFIDYLTNYIQMKEIIVGENHRFGKGKKGSPETLANIGAEKNIKVTTISLLKSNDTLISSSRIRENIKLGTVSIANRLLGRRYSIKGKVLEGQGRGKDMGRPTANLDIPEKKCVPMDGVYVGRARLGKIKYDCLISIGERPTFNDKRAFEVHILNLNRDIKGRLLEVYFVQFLRRRIKFENANELKKAIDRDEKIARQILKNRFIL